LLNGSHFRLQIPMASWHPLAMPSRSVHPLLARFRSLFQHNLAWENDYLRQENKILRSKFGTRVPLTDADRRILVRFGLKIRDRLREVASRATPETFLAWNRRLKEGKWRFDNTPKRLGRPRKDPDTEALVVKLAEVNGAWGYQRIAGELKKLGHSVSPSYVRDVLRRNGLPPSPDRKGLSWKQFIQSHLDVTWAADFFPEEVWTMRGLVTFYVLFCIHLGTRRVFVAGCTPQLNRVWIAQQARNFSMILAEENLPCRFFIHDRDSTFTAFDPMARSDGIRIVKTPPRSPLCNAFAERHVRDIRETLHNLILVGEWHLRHVLKRIEVHHNTRRPHQGIGNVIPVAFDYPENPTRPEQVHCDSVLGGLLNHYYTTPAA
jgi:putative transposase